MVLFCLSGNLLNFDYGAVVNIIGIFVLKNLNAFSIA